MPELPEVQAVVDSLQQLKNKKIESIDIRANVTIPVGQNFIKNLLENKIIDVTRRGKYIIIYLYNNTCENYNYLVAHLRMTGKLYLSSQDTNKKHVHVVIKINNEYLIFEDVRRFGRLELTSSLDFLEKKLGLEPLGKSFDLNIFTKLLDRKRNIKAVLLDQSIIAGIGNIYADEILFKSNINPESFSNNLKKESINKLFLAIKSILKEAVDHKGTTIINFSYNGDQEGNYSSKLKVYGRKKQNCLTCNSLIITKKIAGRTTHYCSICQI